MTHSLFFFFSIKTLFRHSCLDHTCRYKIKVLMVKTLPFASLISVFSSLLGVASLTSWFQFMSSPLLSLSLFFFPAGMPFPPRSPPRSPGHSASQPGSPELFTSLASPSPWKLPPRETWTETRELGNGPGKLPPQCLPGRQRVPRALPPAPQSFLEMSALSLPRGGGGLGAGGPLRPRLPGRRRPQSSRSPAMRVLGGSCGALLACLALAFPVSEANCE